MAGHGDPPKGTPDGLPGGDDEERSVVFDESFIRAARLQEFSARERMGDHTHAVRSLPPKAVPRSVRNGPRQLLTLVLLVVLAFGTAIYLGVRHPYRPLGSSRPTDQLRTTVIPLAPRGKVPGGVPGDLFARSPAAQFREGAAGITLPAVRGTENFTESQVVAALVIVKDYLVASSLDPDVLAGRTVQPVRALIDSDQTAQFDRSMDLPATGATEGADGLPSPVGWLVRFDPAKVTPADPQVRVRGTLSVMDRGPGVLEVTADHTFVYAVRPASSAALPVTDASLFTVRRELHFRFDQADLQKHQAELLVSEVRAGPQACAADVPRTLRPLLTGQQVTGEGAAAVDPYAPGPGAAALCGVLAPQAQPRPAA